MPGEHLLESSAGSPSVPPAWYPRGWWLQRPLHRLALAWHRRKLKLKKTSTNKNLATAPDAEQAISFSQCAPVPLSCSVVLFSPLALVCGCAFDLAAARSARVWGGPQPSLPPSPPGLHTSVSAAAFPLAVPAGRGPSSAAASCPAPELGSAVGLWAEGVHLSSSQFQKLKQSWPGSFTKQWFLRVYFLTLKQTSGEQQAG